MTATDEPSVYVADLAAYNNGHLHGVWIDATDELDDIHAQIRAMLAASPVPDAEEIAIHDAQGFGAWAVGEYEDLATVHAVAVAIAEHGAAMREWLGYGGDVDTFEDAYLGEYASRADFAEELADELGCLERDGRADRWPLYAIDWDRAANDLFLDGYTDLPAPSGGIYVFGAV